MKVKLIDWVVAIVLGIAVITSCTMQQDRTCIRNDNNKEVKP